MLRQAQHKFPQITQDGRQHDAGDFARDIGHTGHPFILFYRLPHTSFHILAGLVGAQQVLRQRFDVLLTGHTGHAQAVVGSL